MGRTLQALLLLAVAALATAQWNKGDRVLLREVATITLHKGQMTNARRTAPVPQLRCVGGDACNAEVRTVQCENKGWDGHDVQWKCNADLSNDYRFGDLAINCEGYDYPNDPYVLAGSCGLEYEMLYTEQGRRNSQHRHEPYSGQWQDTGSRWWDYGSNRWADYSHRMSNYKNSWSDTMHSWWSHPGESWRSWWNRPWHTYSAGPSYSHGETTMWSVIVMGVISFFILRACLNSFNLPARYNYMRPFWGGNVGHHTTPHYGNMGAAPGCDPTTGAPTNAGPGFWTGLGVGGILGNWWNRRRAQYTTRPVTPPPAYHHTPNYRETARTTEDHTGTRTASGYGGTRRR